MEEWIRCNIGDVCKTISDTYRGNADEVVLVNTSDVLEGKCLNHQKSPNKDLKGQFKKTFQKDDILYSEIRPANKRFAYIDFDGTDYIASTKLMVIRHNENIIPQFLYYIITSQAVIEEMQMLAESRSGTFPQITFSELAGLPIELPPLSEQAKIVRLLKSLDAKIEVNRRINDNFYYAFFEVMLIWLLTSHENDNLEQQAQALFKSWFVDFEPFKDGDFEESEYGMIPHGWKIVSLDDMTCKFGTGLNPRKNFRLGEGSNYYVTIKNMGDNRIYLDDKCDKVTDEAIEKINKRSKLQKGDLLFSGIGTIGRVAMITEIPINWNTSESVFNMHPEVKYSTEFLYVLLLSNLFQSYVRIHAQGGVQQGIRMASLKSFQIALPESTILQEFDNLIIPIISAIRENDKEVDNLSQLRDTLLPRLMSGELKVNEIENVI